MCTSPNRVFYKKLNNGDTITKFTFGEKVDHVEVDSRKRFNVCMTPETSPDCIYRLDDYWTVGCYTCDECKMNRARLRTSRMNMQTITQGSKNAWFVTFTYDNEYIPTEEYISDQGEYLIAHTLVKDHMQLFHKRLRKTLFGSNKGNLSYVAIGEYGDGGGRPHYHAIYWNLPLDTGEIIKYNDQEIKMVLNLDPEPTQTGKIQYTSEFLEKLWKKGRVRVSEPDAGSVGYVARYVQKKLYSDDAAEYALQHLIPPFILQSQGIGKDYLLAHADELLKFGEVHVNINGESVTLVPDRYFRKLMSPIYDSQFEIENEKYAALRENRLSKELLNTDKSYEKYMKVKAKDFSSRISTLKRKGDFSNEEKNKKKK